MDSSTQTDAQSQPRTVPAPPETFKKIICDFTADLTTVFPEFSGAWAAWNPDMSDEELKNLFEYCLVFYPGRFFDILNKNDDIFSNDAEGGDTFFLPNVEFKALYNCDGISDKTRDSLWKYLQLILFSTVQAMDNSSFFGDSLKMFDDIDMGDIHTKLEEAMNDMAKMFSGCGTEAPVESDDDQDAEDEAEPKPFWNFGRSSGAPPFNPEQMHNHINTLLNGKIGTLAKELAEDVSREFNDDILQMNEGDLTGNAATDTKTMLEKMMKNPAKIMDLVKKVGGKLDQKMKSGDISQEELMKEVSDIMGKMKDIPGMGDMEGFLKKMGRNFGAGGADMRVDTNALNRATKNQQMKDKLRARLEAKKRAQVEAALAAVQKSAAAELAAAEAAAELAAAELITPGPAPSASKKGGGGKKKGGGKK